MTKWLNGVKVWESVTLIVKAILRGWLGIDNNAGTDLVTNGSFASDTAWTKGTGWSIAAGVASHGTNGTGALEPSTALTVIAGGIYKVTYDVTYTSGTGVTPQIGGTSGATRAVTKTGYIDYIKAATTANLKFTTANADRIDIDNVTCQLMAIGAADRVTVFVDDQGGTAGKGSLVVVSEDGTVTIIGGPNGIESWVADTVESIRIYNAKNPLEYLRLYNDTNGFYISTVAAVGGTGRSLYLGNNRGADYLTLNADGSVQLISKNNGDLTLTPNGTGVVAASKQVQLSSNDDLASAADMVKLSSYDLSAGNRTLSIATETAVAIDAVLASTHTLTVRINGVSYKVLLASV